MRPQNTLQSRRGMMYTHARIQLVHAVWGTRSVNAAKPATSHPYAESAATTQDMVGLPFEPGVYHPSGAFIFAKNPSPEELGQIYHMLVSKIGPHVAPFDVVKAIYQHNPMSLWGVFRSSDHKRRAPKLAGLVAFLPLNEAGDAALKAKRLDGRNPDIALIARPGEEPRMLYLWAIVTPGIFIDRIIVVEPKPRA